MKCTIPGRGVKSELCTTCLYTCYSVVNNIMHNTYLRCAHEVRSRLAFELLHFSFEIGVFIQDWCFSFEIGVFIQNWHFHGF